MKLSNLCKAGMLCASLAAVGLCVNACHSASAADTTPEVGKPWKGWTEGQLQIHLIHTGAGEALFLIFPDSTTMLLDCGDFDALARGELAVPVVPDTVTRPGEWVARYVERVNPRKDDVDYMMLSHYHSDHGGIDNFSRKVERDSADYYLGGFSLAAETLNFGKAFDRAYPDYTDPIPMTEKNTESYSHMKSFYDYMTKHRGMKVEKFREGAVDQVALLHNGKKYPDFSVRNICANGRIADKDGNIRNLYANRVKFYPDWINENGMSLGMIITYGNFKFYTAGDFSDGWDAVEGDESSWIETEDSIADVVEEVNVAKINHHGYKSMTPRLIAALKPQVFVNAVWDQLHTLPETMERIADTTTYGAPRIVCPTIFPKERQAQDAGAAWLDIIDPTAKDGGGHIVITVEPGGEDYTVCYLTADDESMTVRSAKRYHSSQKDKPGTDL